MAARSLAGLFFSFHGAAFREDLPIILQRAFGHVRGKDLSVGFAEEVGFSQTQAAAEILVDGHETQFMVLEEHSLFQVLQERPMLGFALEKGTLTLADFFFQSPGSPARSVDEMKCH